MRGLQGVEERFFQLLQIAVGKTINGKIALSDKEWGDVYRLASEQSLVGLILHAIDTQEEDVGRPSQPLLLQWIGESELIRQRNCRVNQLCGQLTSWFLSKGYDSCILKGQGVARLYNNPECRQSGDIDIWVNANTEDIVKQMRHDCLGVTYVDYVNCHVSFFTDTDVEVHFRPTYMFSPFNNRKVQRWVKDNKDAQFSNYDEGLCFSYPTIAFNLVFSLIHIYRHIFLEGIGLRQLTDYYFILIHSSAQERKEAFLVLQSFKMKRFVGALMYVMKRVFALDEQFLLCEPNIADGEFLVSEILRGGNFGKYDDRNVYVSDDQKIKRGLNNWKRNLRFLKYYPSEVLWMPAWKVWHWCWRKMKGYL